MTLECVERLIKKDMVDPVNGEKLTDKDIIVVQRVSSQPLFLNPRKSHSPS